VVSKVKLRDLGERKVIELARDILSKGSSDELELQDDCAALLFNDDYLLITTDMISQKTHIPQSATSWQIGWYLAAINLSDIAAMGGEPLGLVVALGLPASYDEEFTKGMMEGAYSCVSKYNTSIIGGDTKEADSLTLSGCAIGRVPKNQIIRRKGGILGDIVCVTGELGRSAAAYYSLQNNPENIRYVKDILEINPRIEAGRILAQSKSVTSAMDISDGLASSLYQLSQINNTFYEIDLQRIPKSDSTIEASNKLNIPLEDLILYFGGDYELLITVKKDRFREIKEVLSESGIQLTRIGEIGENQKNMLIKDGVSTFLENRGYEHFRWNL
jgi:thiamine-monophosphate kinase